MAEKNLSVNVRVNTDTGQLEVLGAKLKEAGEAGKKTGGMFSSLGGETGKLFSAFLPFATAGGIVTFFASAVKGASEEAEALKRVGFALEASGVSWKANESKVLAWGAAIQQTTRFSDNEAYEAVGKLARITGDLSQAQTASQVAMGLSITSGQSLSQTTELLSNLLAGNERAVKQARDEYGQFVGNAKTAQEVLTALGSSMATVAQQEEGFAKSSAQLKNAAGELADKVGAALIPSLTVMVDWLKTGFDWFEKLALAVAANAAVVVTSVQYALEQVRNAVSGNFDEMGQRHSEYMASTKAILEGSVEAYKEIENRKVSAVKATSDKTVALVASKNAQVLLEEAKAAAKAIEDAKKAKEVEQKVILELENEMTKKMLALGKSNLKQKQGQLDLELKIEREKIIQSVNDKAKEKELLDKLNVWGINRHKELLDVEMKDKRDGAFKTAEVALQTFNTLNEMGDKSSKAQAARAKTILALEQAIAIARVWAASASFGPFGVALAVAQTALYVAQFAAQSKAIDRAQQAAAENKVNTRLVTPLPGGSRLEDTFSNSAIGSIRTGGIFESGALDTGFSEAGSSFSNTGTIPSSGGGGGGGGGGVMVNVNIPQIIINVGVDTLEVADRRKILQALGDELRSETVESIRFAVTSANVANRNSQVAV